MFTAADIITAMVAAFLAGTIVLFLFVEPLLSKQADTIHNLTKQLEAAGVEATHSEAEYDEAIEVLIQNGLVKP